MRKIEIISAAVGTPFEGTYTVRKLEWDASINAWTVVLSDESLTLDQARRRMTAWFAVEEQEVRRDR